MPKQKTQSEPVSEPKVPVTEMERTLLILGLMKCGAEMAKHSNIMALTELIDKIKKMEVWA